VETLQIIASKSEQYDFFGGEVHNTDIPEVLLAQWEEVYHQSNEQFEEAFSENELHDLNCFYDFLLGRISQFPKHDFEALMKCIYWDSVCRLATELLDTLSRSTEAAS